MMAVQFLFILPLISTVSAQTCSSCVQQVCDATDICTAWVTNTAIDAPNFPGYKHSIQNAQFQIKSPSGYKLVEIHTAGLPGHTLTITQDIVDELNNRPKADSEEWADGTGTTLSNGDAFTFGDDVGYKQHEIGCDMGSWPEGPECPSGSNQGLFFPAETDRSQETDESALCELGLGRVGLWVTGGAVYGWSDGFSYNSAEIWWNLAGVQEQYDLDICGGHAAMGEYHHHGTSRCLLDQVGDTGAAHSPIIGYAGDGYPIYGPYQANGELARSCWVSRDYDSGSDPYGCGGTGDRSCLMVDPYNHTKGTYALNSGDWGPATSDTVTSLSGNTFPGTTAMYFQDFWLNTSCVEEGGASGSLDRFNGHDHGALGYHYHATYDFPFSIGPHLYGKLDEETTFVSCGLEAGMLPGGQKTDDAGAGPIVFIVVAVLVIVCVSLGLYCHCRAGGWMCCPRKDPSDMTHDGKGKYKKSNRQADVRLQVM